MNQQTSLSLQKETKKLYQTAWVLFCYSMLNVFGQIMAALNTLISSQYCVFCLLGLSVESGQLNDPPRTAQSLFLLVARSCSARVILAHQVLADQQSSTTSFLTATNQAYTTRAGVTAAAGTRLALESFLVKCFTLYSFQLHSLIKETALLCFVATSPCRDWVTCAPAAFLGCGSRFSGSLSGTEPLFSVTRHHHGTPLPYRQQLIGQKFE